MVIECVMCSNTNETDKDFFRVETFRIEKEKMDAENPCYATGFHDASPVRFVLCLPQGGRV